MTNISTGRQRGIVPFVDETTGRLPDQYIPQKIIDLQGNLEQAVTNASTSATAAKASETAANSSAQAASTSSESARTASDSATSSKDAAAQSASQASASAQAAETSKTNAASSASAAKISETNASASATAAQQAVDGFGLEVGTTTTGDPGTDAAVEIQKTGTKYTLDFTIPRGGTGDGVKFVYDSEKRVVSNVREYFAAHRDGRTYGVRFPLYSFSNSPDGVKVGDNAGLTVVPSSNYRAGRDDYAGLSAFRVFDANVTVSDDGTPVVKAIKGLVGNYAQDGSNGDVFVITTPGFYRFEFDTNYCTIWYSDTQYNGYSPMPGALRPDGTLRPCMAYAKYPLSNYGGKAASVSGQIPASMSEHGSVSVPTSKGKGYSGKTSADTFYVQLMHMLKYATKDIERYLGGDFNGSGQINVSKAETNVTRALVKATNAASIDLGSYVSVGTGTYRGDNKTGEAAAYRKVISKTVVDAATTAINVSGAAFTTTTAMHVTQMPYLTGSTDGVLGNDGIPREDVSKTHQPIRLQGIELFAGIYETEGDIILKNVKDSDTSGHTEVWKVFDTTKASDTAITADYVHVGDYPAVNDKTDNQWQWQTDFTEKHGFLLPTGVGATSTSGLTDALIINPISAPGLHELQRGGDLGDGSHCGLFDATGGADLSGAWWYVGGRLSILGRTHA